MLCPVHVFRLFVQFFMGLFNSPAIAEPVQTMLYGAISTLF